MLSLASILDFKNNLPSIENLWYPHLGVVPSCHFLTPFDAGTPNVLVEFKSEFSIAPARGTIILLLLLKIALALIFS